MLCSGFGDLPVNLVCLGWCGRNCVGLAILGSFL